MPLVGKVLWWDERDGRGVIEDSRGTEYYFDSSVLRLKPKQKIRRNTLVTFSANHKISDLRCAQDVAIPNQQKKTSLERGFRRERELTGSL